MTPTTTTLVSSANPSTVGANVTFTATVTGSAPTGSVGFTADGTTLTGCGAVALPSRQREQQERYLQYLEPGGGDAQHHRHLWR